MGTITEFEAKEGSVPGVYYLMKIDRDTETKVKVDQDVWILTRDELLAFKNDVEVAMGIRDLVKRALEFFQDKAGYTGREAALLSELLPPEGK